MRWGRAPGRLSARLRVAAAGLLLTGLAAPPAHAQAAVSVVPEPVGTLSELMVHVLYPASDAIFYITTREPTTAEEWGDLEMKALMLAESANLLMQPYFARDQGQWMRDARTLRDAGRAAFAAARARDLDALAGLNDPLYQSCVSCHRNYRSGYGRPPGQ